MKGKTTILRIVFFAAWLLVIAGITVLLVAANKKHDEKICRDVVVNIKGTGDKYYVEASGIIRKLEKAHGTRIIHQAISTISPDQLESVIEKDKWIKDAEIYFDREDVMHVFIEEREPIARVIDLNGNSFYIDSSAHRMPLLEEVNARVPVFTGFPAAKKLNAKDSVLLMEVKELAVIIYNSSFWSAQAGQVMITSDRKFEIMPLIGDHIIRLGHGEKIKEKLDRTLVFYKRVMSKTGFSKYSVVDVQFEGQVVGVHRGSFSAIDSIQLQKNIRELLEKSNIQNLTAEMLPEAVAVNIDSTKNTMGTPPVPVKTNPTPSEKQAPATVKTRPVQNPLPEKNQSEKKTPRIPKAVMTRNN